MNMVRISVWMSFGTRPTFLVRWLHSTRVRRSGGDAVNWDAPSSSMEEISSSGMQTTGHDRLPSIYAKRMAKFVESGDVFGAAEFAQEMVLAPVSHEQVDREMEVHWVVQELKRCEKSETLNTLRRIFDRKGRSAEFKLYLFNRALDTLAEDKKLEQMEWVMRFMDARKIQPDAGTFNRWMIAHQKENYHVDVRTKFASMLHRYLASTPCSTNERMICSHPSRNLRQGFHHKSWTWCGLILEKNTAGTKF